MLGLGKHPALHEALARNAPYHELQTLLRTTLYCADLEVMFLKGKDAKKKHTRRRLDVAKKASQLQTRASLPSRLSDIAVRHRALLHHCLGRLKPGRMCSIVAGDAPVQGVEEALAKIVGEPRCYIQFEQGVKRAMEIDVEDMEASGMMVRRAQADAGASRTVFFRVLKSQVGRNKVVPLAPASGSKLDVNSVAITLHEGSCSDNRATVCTEPLKAVFARSGVAILDLFGFRLEALENN